MPSLCYEPQNKRNCEIFFLLLKLAAKKFHQNVKLKMMNTKISRNNTRKELNEDENEKRRIKEYQFVVEWELKTYSTTHNCELNKNS